MLKCGLGRTIGMCAWLGMAVLAAAQTVRAQETPPPAVGATAPLPIDAARERMMALFQRSCSQCHGAKTTEPSAAKDVVAIDDADQLAQERPLVVPGFPDASRLYQILLSGHRPHAVFTSSTRVPAPSPEDIEAVRDWIEQRPPAEGTCPGREAVSDADMARLADEWRKLAGEAADKLQFVSLAPLYNACRSDAAMARVRDAVAYALAALGGKSEPVPIDTVGELSLLIAFNPEAAGLTGEALAELRSLDPRANPESFTGDWLVSVAHSRKPHDATAAAASGYITRTVDLLTAAAELGETPASLSARLAALDGQDGKLARRLIQTGLPQAEWSGFMAQLKGRPKPESAAAPVPTGTEPLRLSLWSDKLTYKAGDLAQFTAAATGDCYLTLIGIDKAGIATVLFPNDLDAANLLRGGTSMTVPVPGASYQFRFKEAGRESVAGICTAPEKRPQGIGHDFERQRFTVLGPWRAFLRSMSEREAVVARQERRRSRDGATSAIAAGSPPQEARAAIKLTIE